MQESRVSSLLPEVLCLVSLVWLVPSGLTPALAERKPGF